ncbi:MAG: ABC transporter ATP-binding protein [Elusimicrobia bacterium]|nr:ABC transporter ATP-binding protein [Elusimicrobiota bacterium]
MTASAHDEDEAEKSYDGKLLRRFLGYVRPHWRPTAATLTVTLVHIAAGLAAPFIVREALDGPVAAGDADGLLGWTALFFAMVVADGVLETAGHYLSNLAGQRIIYDLRAAVFAHLQKMPVTFYDRNPVGRLLTRVTGDVENLAELFTSGLVGMLSSVLLLVAAAAGMLWLDVRLTLVSLSVLPLLWAATALFRKHARKTYSASRKAIAAVTAYLNESLGGLKTIQSFSREALCVSRFGARNDEHLARSLDSAFVYSFFWPGIECVSTLATALILWYGGGEILRGTLSFGTFLAFWHLLRKFFEPIQELAEKYNILQAAMASSERLFKLLDTAPAVAAPARPVRPSRRGAVEFRGVSHSYDGVTPVLTDLSFKVEPGEKVAIVGYTGAGKTTILSLLLRLYDAQAGSVLVDGVDVREQDPIELRRRFGMVFQDVFLFSGTVRDNLKLGVDASPENLERAARLAHADRVIARLPQGWDTPVQERGAALSVGERQLLSFARALASDPPILVLDEATSSVDAETEGLIQDAVESMLEGRTAIVVAHRLATVRKADRILVMHHGRLREVGSHDQLVAQGGLYDKLVKLQWSGVATL